MDNFILAYQGNILLAEYSPASELRSGYINCSVYKFLDPGRYLLKTSQSKLHLANAGEKFKILKFNCVIDEDSGLQHPYLLVQRSKVGKQNAKDRDAATENSLELFLLSGLESKSPVFQSIGCFNFHGDILARVAVKLFDGPTICWVDGHQVCFVGKESANNNRLTLKNWPRTDSSLGRKSIAKLDIVWCGNIENQPVVMVTKRHYFDLSNTTETKLVCIDMHHNKEYNSKEVQLVPDVYVAISTCYHLYTDYVHAETMEIANKDFRIPFSENENGSSLFSHTKVLVGTSQAQLVEFHRGQFKNFCQLPFEDPCNINLVEVDGLEIVAVVQSLKGEVCAINLSSQQVIRKWKAIERLFIDDFLGRGTEQVIVFSTHQTFGDVITDFTLADFLEPDISGVKEESNPDVPFNSKECSESLERTVHALAMRLQAGVSSVVETQIEYQEKLAMIRKTCDNFHRLVSSCGSCSLANEKPTGMFCLLEGKQSEKENDIPEELADVRPQIRVEDVWQRVVDDKWVVGVELINTGTRAVESISLALVGKQPEVLTSTCQDGIHCVNHTSCKGRANDECNITPETTFSDDILKPPTKKMKIRDSSDMRCSQGLLPGNKTVVVSVTDIPELIFDKEYTCSPVLTYQNKSRDGDQFNESICCTPVTISASQLSEGKLELGTNKDFVSQKRDWIALEAVSIKIQLVLTSTLSSLSNVSSLLQDILGVSEDAVIAVASLDEVDGTQPFPCLKGGKSSLSGACVFVQSWLREARLLIFTRNLRQLCVLLHKLRQLLPDDVSVLPHTTQLVSEAAVKAVNAMTSEVSILTSGLSEALRTRHLDISTASDSSSFKGNKPEELQFARRELERRRAQGTDATLDDASLRRLWDSTLKEQLETDAAVNSFVSLSLC